MASSTSYFIFGVATLVFSIATGVLTMVQVLAPDTLQPIETQSVVTLLAVSTFQLLLLIPMSIVFFGTQWLATPRYFSSRIYQYTMMTLTICTFVFLWFAYAYESYRLGIYTAIAASYILLWVVWLFSIIISKTDPSAKKPRWIL